MTTEATILGVADPPAPVGLADVGRVLARLARQVDVALATVDLSLSQYRVLMLLGGGSAAASSMAERLAVSPPSITAVVDGLVARGLVERRAVLDDRRRVGHALTSTGSELLVAADAAVSERLEQITDQLGDPTLVRAALDPFELWRRALDAHRAQRLAAKAAASPRT